MIAQPFTTPAPADLPSHARWQARKQMAFYLDLAFVKHDDAILFHGLRIEHNGTLEEIDHVVLHRFGLTLIESGSVTGPLTLGPEGLLTRTHPAAAPELIPSPIDRVRRQAQALFGLLNAHCHTLRHAKPFGDERFTVLVAVADQCAIQYRDAPPPEFVRADQVNEAVHAHLHHHLGPSSLNALIQFMRAARTETHGVSAFSSSQLNALHGFMLAYHRPAPSRANLTVVPPPTYHVPNLHELIRKQPRSPMNNRG